MTRLGKNNRNKYDTIKCTNRKCDCVSAPIFLVEQSVLESLQKWLASYIVQIEQSEVESHQSDEIVKLSIEDLNAKIERFNLQINRTYDLLEQGIYTTEVFTQRHKALSERKEEIETRISRLNRSLIKMQNERKVRQEIIPQIRHVIAAYWTCSSAEEKNILLKSVLNRIEYSKSEPNRRGHLDNANFTVGVFPKTPGDLL